MSSGFDPVPSDRLEVTAEAGAALTDFDYRVAASLLKLTKSLRLPKDTLAYLVDYLSMNQPPVPLSSIIGYNDLRLLGGLVNESGTILSGTGFTAARELLGQYLITFSPAFPSTPVGVATALQTVGTIDKGAIVVGLSATVMRVQTITASTGAAVDEGFTFLVSEAH